MSETSAREAVALLSDVLAESHRLTRTASVSELSVTGLMGSLMEARFVEASSRFSTEDRPVTVRRSLVRNKPG